MHSVELGVIKIEELKLLLSLNYICFYTYLLSKIYGQTKYIYLNITPSKLLFVLTLIDSDAGWNSFQQTVVFRD